MICRNTVRRCPAVFLNEDRFRMMMKVMAHIRQITQTRRMLPAIFMSLANIHFDRHLWYGRIR
ncbi:hypothetical protein MJ561_19110 [Klebsiella pneumoniae]|nr:hypothetical protein MJ561_19110 [Klebsiella pneumoniae]